MQMDIQALGFPLTKSLNERVKRRMRFALSGRADAVQRVVVRLSDLNGPKGGRDMCCQIRIVLNQLADVVIRDVETDLYVAIDRGFDRAGRSVARQLDRKLTRQRAPLGSEVALSDSL